MTAHKKTVEKTVEKIEHTFAEQLAELEKIVAWFEKGELSIEEALIKFERGLVLAQTLQQYLGTVEQRVVAMKKKFNV